MDEMKVRTYAYTFHTTDKLLQILSYLRWSPVYELNSQEMVSRDS